MSESFEKFSDNSQDRISEIADREEEIQWILHLHGRPESLPVRQRILRILESLRDDLKKGMK